MMKTNELDVGCVVLNYNNYAETHRFIDMVSHNPMFSIIQVVDNRSTDDSYRKLKQMCSYAKDSRLHLVLCPHNKGYAVGNNYGVQQMLHIKDVKYILIANPDVIFDANVIYELVSFLEAHRDYAAVSPLMRDSSGNVCSSAWKLPSKITMFVKAFALLLPFIGNPLEYGKEIILDGQPHQVDVLPGSLILVRSDVFKLVGGFDESTFLYGEENLLFAKIKRNQWRSALLTGCSYVHAHGTSINKEISSVYKRYLIALKSNIVYCEKVLDASKLYIIIYQITYRLASYIFSVMLVLRDLIMRIFSVNKSS